MGALIWGMQMAVGEVAGEEVVGVGEVLWNPEVGAILIMLVSHLDTTIMMLTGTESTRPTEEILLHPRDATPTTNVVSHSSEKKKEAKGAAEAAVQIATTTAKDAIMSIVAAPAAAEAVVQVDTENTKRSTAGDMIITNITREERRKGERSIVTEVEVEIEAGIVVGVLVRATAQVAKMVTIRTLDERERMKATMSGLKSGLKGLRDVDHMARGSTMIGATEPTQN